MDNKLFSLYVRRILLRPTLLLILTVFFQCICPSWSRSNHFTENAYKTLGVSSDCTQDDIRRSYRKLCLENHPDKNVNKSEKDKKACEDKFKQIQHSYSQIGSPSARKEYDSSLLMSSRYGSAGAYSSSSGTFPGQTNMYNSNNDLDSLFRAMMSGSQYPFGTSRQQRQRPFSFYVNGVDISHLFNSNSAPSFFQKSRMPNDNIQQQPPCPIFIQHVPVSLEDLYTGSNDVEFIYKKKSGIFQMCKAVVRGGLLRSMILQNCVVVFPMFVRLKSFKLTLLFFLVTLFLQLPQNQPEYNTSFISSIQSGWKGGTKLTFKERDYNVVFILDEKPHQSYRREGNNLHSKVKITQRQARTGCTITLPALSNTEESIKITIPPKTKRNEVITLRNRGWPLRNSDKQNGDMMVTVDIIRRKKRKRR